MRKPPESLDAWAAYQRGLWHLSRATPDDDATAEKFFKQAIDLDPAFAGGYSALALYQLQAAAIYQKRDLRNAQRSAEALARRAVALDDADAEARSCIGWALQACGDAAGAVAGQLGRTTEAREALQKAVSRAPGAFDMYVRSRAPWFRPEDHDHLVNGLRKAGWKD